MSIFYSQQDVQWLLSNHENKSLQELAKHLKRSLKSVRQKIRHLKILKNKAGHFTRWTKEEDEKLTKLFNKHIPIKDIAKMFNRTPNSIRLRANKKCGVYRKDSLLRKLNEDNFYISLKHAKIRNSAKTRCCLCKYDKFVDLHHIDGNRENNHISNIS